MRKIIYLLTLSFLSNSTYSQTYNPYYGSIVGNYNADTILTYLNEFEELGIKELGTSALDNTQNWLLDKYNNYGYTDITVDPFSYFGNSTANVIVKKEGCTYPNTYVIVDGHYDTRNGPGTNDNGTGTAIILEMARLLKDVQTEYSILFIHFSGEEDGLKGSQHYVDNTVIPQNMDIKVVFNIDEVGGVNGMTNNTIVCEQDEGAPTANNAQSSIYTNELATCVGLYSSLSTEISYAYASDYMPFEDNGEIITGFYEKNESPYPHTINDSLSKMDPVYAHEVGKAAMGGTLHFAQAFGATPITASACSSYTSPSGNYEWTSTGMYNDTLPSVAGCDSVLTVDLTINGSTPIASNAGATITVDNQSASAYQWVDCDLNYIPISGENASTYTPGPITGNFAVIVTDNGCTDTSNCVYYEAWGLDELGQYNIEIYPNPSNDVIGVNFGTLKGEKSINIYNEIGQVVLKNETSNLDQHQIDISYLRSGVYYLTVTSESVIRSRQKLIVID